MPREALWHVLRKYAFALVNIVKIMFDGATTPEIEVTNGPGHGCTITPTLFSMYFNCVLQQWCEKCQPFGVQLGSLEMWREVGGREVTKALDDDSY